MNRPYIKTDENEPRACRECGERLIGRADKKFCSDPCRITYNNRLNSDTSNLLRSINRTLRKNRGILEELNPSGKTKVTRERLNQHGFNFNYFTNIYTTREGATYYYCYEQGYLALENSYCLLVRK